MRSSAFTLIELIAVMTVIAILALVVTPSFTSASSAQVGAGARLLAADLQYARQRAAASGEITWVSIDVVADTWAVLREDAATPGFANAVTLEKVSGIGPWVVDPESVGFDGVDITAASFDGAPAIGFDWLGRPIATTGVQLAADGTISFQTGQILTIQTGSGRVLGP